MAHGVELRTPLVDIHLLEQLVPCLPQLAHFPGKALLAPGPRLSGWAGWMKTVVGAYEAG